jgi:hypothetical protein
VVEVEGPSPSTDRAWDQVFTCVPSGIISFSHTPLTGRTLPQGKVVLVFGCENCRMRLSLAIDSHEKSPVGLNQGENSNISLNDDMPRRLTERDKMLGKKLE